MSKLSAHISSGKRDGFGDFLKKCSDSGSPIKVLYSVDNDLSEDVKKFSPTTLLCYRYQTGAFERLPEGMFTSEPVKLARQWLLGEDNIYRDEQKHSLLENWRLNPADFYDPLNESVPDIKDKMLWYVEFTNTLLEIAHQNNIKLAIGSFATGSPPVEMYQYFLPSLRLGMKYGAILNLHAYWEQADPSKDIYNALRYREIYKTLPEDCKLPIIISEASSGNGYDTGKSGQSWVDDMAKYDAELMKDSFVLSACGFQLGGQESNLYKILPIYGDYISKHPSEENMSVDYVVKVHLLPGVNTLKPSTQDEVQYVLDTSYKLQESIVYSADDAKRLVQDGKVGSKVIVWESSRYQNSIVNFLSPCKVELRTFPKV